MVLERLRAHFVHSGNIVGFGTNMLAGGLGYTAVTFNAMLGQELLRGSRSARSLAN